MVIMEKLIQDPFHLSVLAIFNEFRRQRWDPQGWTGMYISVILSLTAKLIKNSYQNFPI